MPTTPEEEEAYSILGQLSNANAPNSTHTHSILTAIFPGEPGLAGCPLNSPSPFIPGLCMHQTVHNYYK